MPSCVDDIPAIPGKAREELKMGLLLREATRFGGRQVAQMDVTERLKDDEFFVGRNLYPSATS